MSVAGEMWGSAGAKAAKFDKPGDTVEGEIVEVQTKQLTEFGTERLECWPDGNPKMTPIVTVQTEIFESEEDDGRRALYMRGGLFTAFREALREAFDTKPDDDDLQGCELKVQFWKTAPSKFKGNPRKVYRCKLTRPSTAGKAWEHEDPGPDDESIPF